MSTGDFSEALEALLGPNAKGLSAKTITRLKADWWHDYEAWGKRDLGTRRFLYIWADGVYFKPRMAEEKQCVLVIVGADEYGHKELLAMTPFVTLLRKPRPSSWPGKGWLPRKHPKLARGAA